MIRGKIHSPARPGPSAGWMYAGCRSGQSNVVLGSLWVAADGAPPAVEGRSLVLLVCDRSCSSRGEMGRCAPIQARSGRRCVGRNAAGTVVCAGLHRVLPREAVPGSLPDVNGRGACGVPLAWDGPWMGWLTECCVGDLVYWPAAAPGLVIGTWASRPGPNVPARLPVWPCVPACPTQLEVPASRGSLLGDEGRADGAAQEGREAGTQPGYRHVRECR